MKPKLKVKAKIKVSLSWTLVTRCHKYNHESCVLALWNKTFTLELIIQGLIQIYTKDISLNLTKVKILFMASIGKTTFNNDGLTIHPMSNIVVQQSLSTLPNLSLYLISRLTCWYEQL